MAQWTSKYAILRDLSVAQGRVPVAIERTVVAGDKPPSLNITEETEEEFFKHGSASANVSAAPDLGLIQKMLDMVRDVDNWSDDNDMEKGVVISKLNPQCPVFTPGQKNTSTPVVQSPTKEIEKKTKKRQRNIAVESILQGIADNKRSNEVILRRPNDFITNKVETKTVCDETEVLKELQLSKDLSGGDNNPSSTPTAAEKVKVWFETQTESPFPKKANKVTLEAGKIVFRKKEKLLNKNSEQFPKENLKNLKSPVSSSSNSGEYVPSTLANEYYLKYLEHNKFKESVKDDIWMKAERKMKELDEKRRLEAIQVVASPSSVSPASGLNQSFEDTQSTDAFTARVVAETKISRCLESVGLSQHRHRLPGDCVVCKVMAKKPEQPRTQMDQDVNSKKADLINNTLENAQFVNNSLENADFVNNSLENADFVNNSLGNADFVNNSLENDDFETNTENAGFRNNAVDNACYKELENGKQMKNKAESKNKHDHVNLKQDPSKELSNIEISDLINHELAKFVQNTDISNKPPYSNEEFKSCVENKLQKVNLQHDESVLSDLSF